MARRTMVNARAPVARLIHLPIIVVVLFVTARIEVVAALLMIQSVLRGTGRLSGRRRG